MKKVVLLTSSRADLGIYTSFINIILEDPLIDLHVVAFGTHHSKFHGNTINEVKKLKIKNLHYVYNMILSDSVESTSTAIGTTILKFSSFWASLFKIDLIVALGDRYEMFGAVAASIPFNIEVLHIHGGETTLGSIDNKFRHSLTIFSKYHFVSNFIHGKRVSEIIGHSNNVYNIGSLSLDLIKSLNLLSKIKLESLYNLNFSEPVLLITCHPETVSPSLNEKFIEELILALKMVHGYKFIFTMPNADNGGQLMREKIENFNQENDSVYLIENFGSLGYFSCMSHCQLLIGNSSSGIIEAASLKKYVINIGNRQLGRVKSENVIDVPFNAKLIANAIMDTSEKGEYNGINVYSIDEMLSSELAFEYLKNKILND